MKFTGKKGQEIFNPRTKCTLGRFNIKTGVFETENPETIEQIKRENLADWEGKEKAEKETKSKGRKDESKDK